MQRLSVRSNKILLALHMRQQGFSEAQRVRLINRLGDGKIWEVIKKYGPIVFQVFVKYILPLLLVLEQPEGPPQSVLLDESEEKLMSANIPGHDHKDDTEVE